MILNKKIMTIKFILSQLLINFHFQIILILIIKLHYFVIPSNQIVILINLINIYQSLPYHK